MSRFSKIIIITSILAVAASLTLIAQAQDTMKSYQYRMESSYLEIQRISHSQNLPLGKKENGKEKIVGQVNVVDRYLISGIPENEFLDRYPYLKLGFKELEISIEADQPLFKKENFYQSSSFLEKTRSLLGFETLPEHRLTKEIKNISGNLETNLKMPGLEFKTSYRKIDRENVDGDGEIKQTLFFKNNSNNEINLQLTLSHSFEGLSILFGGITYLISENPQFLSPSIANSVSFSPDGQRHFTYNFSDLLEFNPQVWVFKEGFQNQLLVKISLSLSPGSSIIIDPGYQVDTSVANDATAYSFQRKAWWDGSRYWTAFFEPSGSAIEFHYSITGQSSWASNTSAGIITSNSDFSVFGNSSDLFIVYSDGFDIFAREASGTYPGTGWEWTDPTTVCTPALRGETCIYPYINKDAVGYLWATYKYSSLTADEYFRAIRSSTTNNISEWKTASTLDISFDGNKYGVIVPQSSVVQEAVYAVWIDGTTIEGARYTRVGGWGSATTIDTGSIGLADNMSAVHDTTNYYVHLIYPINPPGTTTPTMVYRKYTTSWGGRIILATTVGTYHYPSISMDTNTDDLYAFWRDELGAPTTYYWDYRKGSSPYGSSDWESVTTWNSTDTSMTYLTTNYSDNDKIYGIWTEGAGPSFDVKWDEISINAVPSVGTVILNGGNNITLTENATATVSATATVTDTNTYLDFKTIEGKVYYSGVGSGCTANDNTCYSDSLCATSSCSGNSCVATCEYEIWFHATPTDGGSDSSFWETYIKAIDKQDASSTATTSQEMITLRALGLSTSNINYGTIGAGQNSGTLNETTTVTNTGNSAMDINLYGTDLASTTGGWLYGYSYRTEIPVASSSAGAQTDYQKEITVKYESGSNSSSTVYCNYNCQADFDDIRFTQSDGTTELDYWVESLTSASTANIWVELSSTPANGTTSYYLYYHFHDLGIASSSNGTNTFLFFDDFSTDPTSNYATHSTYWAGIDNSWWRSDTDQDSRRVRFKANMDELGVDPSTPSYGTQQNFGASSHYTNGVTAYGSSTFWRIVVDKDAAGCGSNGDNACLRLGTRDDGNQHFSANLLVLNENASYTFEMEIEANSQVIGEVWATSGAVIYATTVGTATSVADDFDDKVIYHRYYEEELGSPSSTLNWNSTNGTLDSFSRRGCVGCDESYIGIDIDWWLVGKYASPEPPWEGPGSEETGNVIPVGNLEWSTSTGESYGDGTDATSSTSYSVELDLGKPTAHSSNTSTDDIYWGIGIPAGQGFGAYSGTSTFESTAD